MSVQSKPLYQARERERERERERDLLKVMEANVVLQLTRVFSYSLSKLVYELLHIYNWGVLVSLCVCHSSVCVAVSCLHSVNFRIWFEQF